MTGATCSKMMPLLFDHSTNHTQKHNRTKIQSSISQDIEKVRWAIYCRALLQYQQHNDISYRPNQPADQHDAIPAVVAELNLCSWESSFTASAF